MNNLIRRGVSVCCHPSIATTVRWAGTAAVLLGGTAVESHAQLGKGVEISPTPFLKPSGRYAVGTREYLWVDQKRDERLTKDPADKRHLMVQVWYPADSAPGTTSARYVAHPDEFAAPAEFKPVLQVTANAFADAPVAKAGGKFPVLVYNHGGGWNRFSATFTTETMASHGYVVVSVEHTGFAKIELFPDGYRFKPDTLGFPKPTGKMSDDVAASWGYLNDVLFPDWVADASFALDRVEDFNRTKDSPLRGRLDLDRIGMFGWSFGGATAIQATKSDPRVKAAVDQDGQLFGDVRDLGTHRPFMLMHNSSDPAAGQSPENQAVLKEALEKVKAYDKALLDRSTGDGYEVEIANSQHGNFSDLMLFFPSAPKQIDPRRAHEIINAYTLAFFDRYLRGTASNLLDGPSPQFSDVTFTTKKR